MWPAWLLVLLSLAVLLLWWSIMVMVLMLMMLLSMVAVVPLTVAPRPQVLTSLVRRRQFERNLLMFRGAVHSPAGHRHHPPRWFLGQGAGHFLANSLAATTTRQTA